MADGNDDRRATDQEGRALGLERGLDAALAEIERLKAEMVKARDALRAVDVWYALDGDGISEPTRSQVKTALAALAPCATCDGSGQITRVRMVPCIEYGPPQPGGRLMQTLGSAPQQELELCNACQGTGAALEGRDG